MKLLIQNGRVLDPKSNRDEIADILIENGKVKKIASSIKEEDCQVLDATDRIVAPGFVDIHVHLREPGFGHKETIRSGTEAAAAGGVTTVACMPNTNPAIHDASVVNWIKNASKEVGCVNVEVVGAITEGIAGSKLADIEAMIESGIIGISDDGRTTMSKDLMKEAMLLIKDTKMSLISHAEDHDISEGGCMHQGSRSAELGLPGIPAEAEYNIVKRDIQLAEETGAALHIAHVSTKQSVQYVKEAKAKGLPVTCEIGPHHFLLNDSIVSKEATNTKVNPPIRDESHRLAMIQGIKEGVIDIIATDHAPHDFESKNKPYEQAAFGISGIESMFGLSYTELVKNQNLPLMKLIDMMTSKPSEIIGLDRGQIKVGKEADIVILNLNDIYKINSNTFLSKGKNTPFDGYEVTGRVETTIVNGKIVYQGGKIKC